MKRMSRETDDLVSFYIVVGFLLLLFVGGILGGCGINEPPATLHDWIVSVSKPTTERN